MNSFIQNWLNFWLDKIAEAKTSKELIEHEKVFKKESREINKVLFAPKD